MKRHQKIIAFSVVLYTTIICQNAVAAQIVSISWSGKVTDILEFKDDAVPAGIKVSDRITGTLRFDKSAYNFTSSRMGNWDYGDTFYYYTGLRQTFWINEWSWVLDSGEVKLSSFYGEEAKYFSIYTTSDDDWFKYTKIPNLLNHFEMGFYLKDAYEPLDLFDTYSLNLLNLNLQEVTSCQGHLASREFNDMREIVDGYYIIFEISEVRISVVPIPGVSHLLLYNQ